MNPYRSGKLVLFQVTYDRDWHFFEIIFFVILGIFGVSPNLVCTPVVRVLTSTSGSIWRFRGQIQHAVCGLPPQIPCQLASR